MTAAFYIAATIAIVGVFLAITRRNAVHSLLYMITSLLAGSIIFYVLGAPYIAALQTIVYAGAIMVLFIFVIMMLNQGPDTAVQERLWLKPKAWIGPSILSAILLAEIIFIVRGDGSWLPGKRVVSSKEVSLALYGPYLLVIELASMLLLAGLIGAYHLGRRCRAA
ncbi:MAG TPA: NADH-quinone oxidoreductase subunit J [Candidatus Hydrogenedentes bacterium]|nr:NADH-quinone oxidoreductase subunit J [Candidatus Hydrogenedentota bacterium]